eukprot:gnl/TRDRNA2_/TRDRNA2_126123_c0_seq1.p1 gnl/TRDRNA2_/TRDRNA2_126123_c0~~gnl/TRDRNA2_/TRDRNA2_126123_c0_seq1.p1  ORF type:complete len:629 (-),score=80.17 gnl/TRDRNA2_/TRDRNA2_126123_c0_seq1:66-1952(-)
MVSPCAWNMLVAAACDISPESLSQPGSSDIGILRQNLIVHLLEISQAPKSTKLKTWTVLEQLLELVKCGILTRGAIQSCYNSYLGGSDESAGENDELGLQKTAHLMKPCAVVPTVSFPRFQTEFECLGLLGRGTFGEVWRCRHLVDGREYAVKIIRYRVGGSAGRGVERRVMREAETLASMSHPNVMRYYQSWIEPESTESSSPCSSSSTDTAAARALLPPPTFAPPPSPALRFQSIPVAPVDSSRFLEPLDGTDSESSCWEPSYDDGSCDGVVFFTENSENDPSSEEECSRVATPGEIKSHHTPTEVSRDDIGAKTLSRASSKARTHSEEIDTYPDYAATLYIQTELCRDETLHGWIANRNALCGGLTDTGNEGDEPWARDAVRIFHQCVRALLHLHKRSCVHRDVKPSNIFFAQDGAVRLGDFGLAKVLESQPEPEDGPSPEPGEPVGSRSPLAVCKLGSRGTIGTPSYASPEQLARKPAGVATDVYSLGLVLAELICPVQTQMERFAVLERLRGRRVLPPAAEDAFPALAELAVTMTDPDPDKRPAASQLLRAARQILRESRQTCRGTASQAKAVGTSSRQSKAISGRRGIILPGRARRRRPRALRIFARERSLSPGPLRRLTTM